MKKFNLFNEIIILKKESLLKAIELSKPFAIDIYGEIKYEPFLQGDMLIYHGLANLDEGLTKSLGQNYQLVEDKERVLIKAFSNWQEIIKLNISRASYDDTTADGIAEFSNKELESIGWYSDEFNINYRTLVEVLEEKCDGIVLCIEQEDPYQFSGLGFIKDNVKAKEILFEFCKEKAKELIETDPDFAKENLTDDELEAGEFFGVV
ncbi:MAG: hypothetical protein GXO30_02770 [Epsilonproteobacteria bacterium]|nr:hypothetical protein [Campylobacterota bacterium]